MGDVSGLISDPKFQGLAPADQRAALFGVTRDQAFNSLNDDQTKQFITGIQAKAISANPPGVPRPATPASMNYDRDIFGEVTPFNSRVGQRIKQNVSMIPNALDTLSPNAQIAQHGSQELQKVTGGPQGVHQMLYGQATNPIDKGLALATSGVRMIGNQIAGYTQDPATAVGDIVSAAPALAELSNRPQASVAARPVTEGPPAPPPEVATPDAYRQRVATMTPEQQAQYTRNIDRTNLQLEKQQRAETLTRNQQQLAGIIQNDVKQTHQRVLGDLAQRSAAIRESTVTQPIPTQPIMEAIGNARAMLSGVPEDLRIFNQIVNHLENTGEMTPEMQALQKQTFDAMQGGDAAAQQAAAAQYKAATGGGAAPTSIPFADAHRQFTALGDAWANADGNVRRALASVKDAYANHLQAGADAAGIGPEFSQLQKEWSQYFKDWRGRTPLSKILTAPQANYVVQQLKGVGRDLAIDQYGRYGDPQGMREFQRITQEGKRPVAPRIPPPPAPTPEAPKQTLGGRMIEHGARLAGKITGGYIGTKLGHPLVGYGAGGEIGSEIGRRIARPPAKLSAPPPSPDAYTRMLLDAKEGLTTPAEANARIQRAGGSVKTRPIPRQDE